MNRYIDAFSMARSYTTTVPAQKIKAAFQEPMLLLPARVLPEGPKWAYELFLRISRNY
jgi:hypothetical protein